MEDFFPKLSSEDDEIIFASDFHYVLMFLHT